MSTKRSCIFCQKTSTSREHVLPKWLRKLYPKNMIITNQFTGKSQHKWSSRIFQHKVKIVCSSCNNRWMSMLENKTIPVLSKMLQLSNMMLEKEDQAILAFWAQKTILMLNRSVPGDLKIPNELYKELYLNQSASPKILVKIGWRMMNKGTVDNPIVSYEIKQVTSINTKSELSDEVMRQRDNGGFIWKAVLAIGPVVFEFIGHNMKIRLEVGSDNETLVSIRPFIKNIIWPLDWPIEAEGGLLKLKEKD